MLTASARVLDFADNCRPAWIVEATGWVSVPRAEAKGIVASTWASADEEAAVCVFDTDVVLCRLEEVCMPQGTCTLSFTDAKAADTQRSGSEPLDPRQLTLEI